jgi:hypothetical protein
MPFPNSNTGSTVTTPITSREDEEEYNFQRKPLAMVMRATGMRRKRSAESDDGNLSVSTKPAKKRTAKAVYVDIPVPSTNVSVGITLTFMGCD